jgi:hypothetical protein
MEGFGVGTLFRQLTYAGDRDGTLRILDEKHTLLPRSGQPNTAGSWLMLALVIEGLVMLGEHSQTGRFYPLFCELIGTGPVVLWPIFRLTHTIAGLAAAAARQREAAEEHFEIAMQQAESFPNRLEQTEIRRFHAMMLINRAAPGDREKAQTLLTEALESYTQIGMPPPCRDNPDPPRPGCGCWRIRGRLRSTPSAPPAACSAKRDGNNYRGAASDAISLRCLSNGSPQTVTLFPLKPVKVKPV